MVVIASGNSKIMDKSHPAGFSQSIDGYTGVVPRVREKFIRRANDDPCK
jgi:hypothetical protein